MKLAPLDYYFARPNLFSIQFALRFDYPLDAALLRRSFAEVSDVYSPVRSCLEEKDGELFLVPGAVPALETVDYRKPHLELRTSLREPLARLGLANEKGRSVLSFTFSHGVGDGFSYFLFLGALAQAYQRKDFPIPELNRRLLDAETPSGFSERTLPDRISYFLAADPVEVERPKGAETFDLEAGFSFHESESDRQMATLFQRYAETSRFGDQYLLRFPVDFRRILKLPPLYFGNAVRDALVRLPKSPKEYALSDLAQLVRKAKKQIDETNVRDALACYGQLRRNLGLEGFRRLQYPGLLVSNLTRIPLETLDFGGGAPEVGNGPGTPRLALLQPGGAGGTRVTYYH